ncbi:MAG: PQQ-binding-like beta-propeller repeat protein, partial [Verrucomicrobiaceae bacterium]
GNSSPIVWGDRVFVTQSIEKTNRRMLMCFDRKDGALLWSSGVTYAGEDTTHESNPHCSASPVTDGECVIAWFGSGGVHCYDFAGKELWSRDLGKQEHVFGYGSSPIFQGNLCILNFGPGTRSFLVALDKKTGKTIWEVKEPGFTKQYDAPPGSFSTPLVVPHKGREELIHAWPGRLTALEPATGRELWFCSGLDQQTLASPMAGDGVAVSMGGFRGSSIAVKLGGAGEVTETQRLWVNKTTLIATGIIYDGHVYVVKNNGVAACLKLESGEKVWEERLIGASKSGGAWASMVLADGKIYVPNQTGETFVLRASPKFELIANNFIGSEPCNASLAVSQDEIFLRTHEALWCFGK